MEESDKYPLNRKWKIWEMWNQNKQNSATFTANMQEIGEFDTIFKFWQHWNYYPHADPSYLFEDPETKTKVIIEGLNQSIEAIGVFVDGIKPAWEDAVNVEGCDLCIRKSSGEFKRLKELWDALVISVIGENLPGSEDIVGCRVVDKKSSYKFELWLKFNMLNEKAEKGNCIKNALAALMGVSSNAVSVLAHHKA